MSYTVEHIVVTFEVDGQIEQHGMSFRTDHPVSPAVRTVASARRAWGSDIRITDVTSNGFETFEDSTSTVGDRGVW